MSYISQYIEKINLNNKKALTIFLTTGFPDKNKFIETACSLLDAGADIFELGIPFSDPIADGPVIQKASDQALKNNINMNDVFEAAEKIKFRTNKPVILMGYSNPIYNYGITNFVNQAKNSGVDGVIIPDIPLEEHNTFFTEKFNGLDSILLTTPTSSTERISEIDSKSNGFVYCVSVKGTTGGTNVFNEEVIDNIKRTYKNVNKNKMMVGFGISSSEDINKIKNHCDGVIVASSIMKKMQQEDYKLENIQKFVNELSAACELN